VALEALAALRAPAAELTLSPSLEALVALEALEALE
jgi:hypothetical protein